ncbi:YfdX protein [Candidatus Kuenenia stuttgartiensis]|uniref:YfdX protein n=1 Tax=Kuenenia stuttgartiensis TaxID=174633 RepID=A0A2C9CLM3_KUEST|nr:MULTISPECIES: YfdX family protein [Kuenenia]MBE7549384.1 YfdX family protein [Planctomycetia bacterium]MBZ0191222.1 YfdX family protein [Candidatus Kuenenia stuttgartiensis]MCL4727990.1 YfdX family protein [Candidatus Kuenenia stuttgartiensis]MCZ7623279.1 YfdX family protein [Candidatus Kuenenia sp.]QII11867.1 YfdX protein [Candidatus Kuenenia stuttgartiensis]
MNVIRKFFHDRKGTVISGVVALIALSLFMCATVIASEKALGGGEQRDQSYITFGSGKRYQTTVERYTEGALSAQDKHQASLLTSRIVNHLNNAAKSLIDQNPEAAKPEIKNAQRLTQVVRELLPVTTVTTSVKDVSGKVVYREVDKVQDDKIALYEGTIAMEIVEPIIDAKEKEAALKGLRLADVDVIYTSVLVDLSYIERKLNHTESLLDKGKPDEALVQLALAQTKGVKLVFHEVDNPLVEVQHALRLAERMVEEGKHEAAQDNLRLAQIQLGTYRALLEDEEAKKIVKQLEDDITKLTTKIEEKGAASKIRKFWERAVNLFSKETGQAHTEEKTEQTQERKK